MLSFKDYILEAFDKPYKIHGGYKSSSSLNLYEFYFETDSSRIFTVDVKHQTEMPSDDEQETYDSYEFKFSLKGKSARDLTFFFDQRVLSTVVAIIKQILDERTVKILDISGTSSKRANLYTKIASRIAKEFKGPYRVYRLNRDDIAIVHKYVNISIDNMKRYMDEL